MDELNLNRLYLLYQSGAATTTKDPDESELLQVAKAVGNDLTIDEFFWLAGEINSLRDIRDTRARQVDNYNSPKGSIDNYSAQRMGPKEYQERLWELPDLVRSHEKPFMPTRLADGTPIDIDKHAPKETQDKLKGLPYRQVKHDPRLRDAWHAAQDGKLSELLEHGDVWQAFTDTKAMSEAIGGRDINRDSLSGPLRQMLASVDAGVHQSNLSPTAKYEAQSLPTWRIYQYKPETVVERLLDNEMKSTWRSHHITEKGLDKVPTQTPIEDVYKQDPTAVRKWVAEIREYHEMQIRQSMVKKQLADYVPSVAQSAATTGLDVPGPTPTQQTVKLNETEKTERATPAMKPDDVRQTVVDNAVRNVEENPGIVEQLVPANGKGAVDSIQVLLDGIGVADPTPITDGANAAISLVRAVSDPKNSGEHLVNAATSAVSMVPYVGDIAKLFKYGAKGAKAATPAANTGSNAASILGRLAGAGSGSNGGGGGFIGRILGGLGGGAAAAGGAGGGGGVFTGAAAAAGGAGGGGAAAAGAGLSGMAGPIGLAIAAVVGDALQRFSSAKRLLEPPEYTGNSFDSAKSMMGRGMDNFNTFAPMPIKWGPIGIVLGAATRGLQKMVDWLKKVEDAGNKMLEQNRGLANYNGAVAGAYAQLDADRVRREMSRANSMSGPLTDLAKNQSEFEAAKQDLFQPIEKLQVVVQSKLTWLGTKVIQIIDRLEGITEFIDWWIGEKKSDEARSALEHVVQNSKPIVRNKL